MTTGLANAVAAQPDGDRTDALERSIALQQEALAQTDPAGAPSDWARAHMNLAISYAERSVGSRTDNIERAIALLEMGLVVLTSYNGYEWMRVCMTFTHE